MFFSGIDSLRGRNANQFVQDVLQEYSHKVLYSMLIFIVRHYQVTTPITTFYLRLPVEAVLSQPDVRSYINLRLETRKTLVPADVQQKRHFIGRLTNALALL